MCKRDSPVAARTWAAAAASRTLRQAQEGIRECGRCRQSHAQREEGATARMEGFERRSFVVRSGRGAVAALRS